MAMWLLVALLLSSTLKVDAQSAESITKLFPSVSTSTDYYSDWGDEETITVVGQSHDKFPELSLGGSGRIDFGDDKVRMTNGSPRLFIENDNPGWRNVELTTYAQLVSRFQIGFTSDRGFKMTLRGNHDLHEQNMCEAHSYYAHFQFDAKRVVFYKEFEHQQGSTPVFSVTIQSPTLPILESNYWGDNWLGMKFIVRDNTDGRSVNLRWYYDLTNGRNGGDWILGGEYDDVELGRQGNGNINCNYDYNPPGVLSRRSPVLRSGRIASLQSDGVRDAGVYWTHTSVREINAMPLATQSPQPGVTDPPTDGNNNEAPTPAPGPGEASDGSGMGSMIMAIAASVSGVGVLGLLIVLGRNRNSGDSISLLPTTRSKGGGGGATKGGTKLHGLGKLSKSSSQKPKAEKASSQKSVTSSNKRMSSMNSRLSSNPAGPPGYKNPPPKSSLPPVNKKKSVNKSAKTKSANEDRKSSKFGFKGLTSRITSSMTPSTASSSSGITIADLGTPGETRAERLKKLNALVDDAI